jgi:signal transduction histidine kinase
MAAQLRRRSPISRAVQAEMQVARLQGVVSRMRSEFDANLQRAKLASLAELAAGAGHEINNPLAVISGNAQRLRRDEVDPERRQSLDRITAHVQRITDIIRDMMLFAKPSVPNPERFSVGELVREIGQQWQAEASARNVSLTWDLQAGLWVEADRSQIRRCIESLLRNAIEASPKASVVTLTSFEDDGTVRLQVEDRGPGPDGAMIPHLFDPFFSGRSAGRGRGLGLPTAWRLAKQNQGEIVFTRQLDATIFELRLPLATATLKLTA